MRNLRITYLFERVVNVIAKVSESFNKLRLTRLTNAQIHADQAIMS